MQSFWLIFQLLCCLAIGYTGIRWIPTVIQNVGFKILPYFSYLLLIAISFEFAAVFESLQHPMQILSSSLQIALFTSIGAFGCCYLLFQWVGYTPSHGKISAQLVFRSLLNISYAAIALLLGYLLYELFQILDIPLQPDAWSLLLIFMLLIGLDLAKSPLDRSWLNWKILLVPLSCVIGSVFGILLYASLYQNIALKDLIMLSQGYGFYSMSGIVITELRNAELGSIALMNDLFREIIAILFMYCLGWKYPRCGISAAGATAMDATLPMVKQACGNDFIPHAMVSGFILSILAPVAVSVLAVI